MSSGTNDGVEQKGGIIDDSLGIGYESRICKAPPDFLSILHRLIAPALPGGFLQLARPSSSATWEDREDGESIVQMLQRLRRLSHRSSSLRQSVLAMPELVCSQLEL